MDWFLLGGYFIAAFLLLGGVMLARWRAGRERRPFSQKHRLLRGPGESLLRQLRAQRQAGLGDILVVLSIPIVAGAALFQVITHLDGFPQAFALFVIVVGLVSTLLVLGKRLLGRVRHTGNLYLGYFGERVVAEALEPLKARGFAVFHDVPGETGGGAFNIDHVLVGPSGVFAVETKTRRQGAQTSGVMLHEIIHDGQVLAFPWGEDRHGLDQTARHAQWLGDALSGGLQVPVAVTPILTFPGWTVVHRNSGAVRVLAPEEIVEALGADAHNGGAPKLTDGQQARIRAWLDARCRDVAF